MSRPDQWICVATGTIILVHISIWIVGLATYKLPFLITMLNLAFGAGVIVYWMYKQLRIVQHIFEAREFIVLGLEMLVVAFATYSAITKQYGAWLKGIQYLAFGIHLAILIVFLLFMLTFKMKRLF